MNKWDTERNELEEADDDAIYPEGCPEKPDEKAMFEAAGQGIKDQRETDEAFLAEFAEAIGARVPVIELNTDMTADFVHIKLNAQLDKNFQMRPDLIERDLASELAEKELAFYEQSYQYRQSKFGRCSPIGLSNPVKSRDFAVLYRERIYYPADAEERKMFLDEPSKYVKGHSMPLDIDYTPKICLLGLMKSGKTELAQSLSQSTKCVHLNMDDIIQQYIDLDSCQCEKLRKFMKQEGRGIDDNFMIQLLAKRTQQKDCLQNGWILEDFPKTKLQA